MKTLIVGAGVIGTIYGWALSEAGVDVTHFVRKGKAEKFQNGVTMDVLDERKGYPPKIVKPYAIRCVEEVRPSDGYELVIVPTNTHQTEDALKALVPVTGNAVFLIFSGNWSGVEFIDRLLPRECYLMGYADGGGTTRDDGTTYWVNLGAEIHLGGVEGYSAENLEKVKTLFARADIKADLQDNIVHWLWLHNAMATPFAAGLAKYNDIQRYLKDTALLKECFYASREMIELCRQRGVDPGKYPETGQMRLPGWLFPILFRWLYAHNESMHRFTAHAVTGMPETKATYRDVMQTAAQQHFEMPHMSALGSYIGNPS